MNMPPPSWKLVMGFAILGCVFVLAMAVAIGHVHQESSYGLPEILGCLATLAGAFATWAFGHKDKNGDE